jgi:hypothetical protein
MRTSCSVLWVENSVINSEKFEPERCGNKINPSNLTLRPLDDKTSWRQFNSVSAWKWQSTIINTPFGVPKDIPSLRIYCELKKNVFFFFFFFIQVFYRPTTGWVPVACGPVGGI